ncbi:hypothetical protein E4J66_08945 [Actinomyces viscosus]|uniref:Uncharacterized protein n=1 Tax=Actinomyces viscosus TaxID=1656 RepID=A0A448PNJ2_ACTVI|nr:hypothetical protein [Actinomyces viscosus]TFH52197.1 hypothetical protein E4J66_08945 [Actinomyces viscosus]VEI17746.1 Uncharacterised protein [Actinomyces viscosus]
MYKSVEVDGLLAALALHQGAARLSTLCDTRTERRRAIQAARDGLISLHPNQVIALKDADPRFILCRRVKGVITCAHAMAYYGLPLQSGTTALHIATPCNQGHVPDGIGHVVIHRMSGLILPAPEAAPVASVEQALICYLRCADDLDALIAVDAALRLHLTTRPQLEDLLQGPRNRHSRMLVARSHAEARSLLETIARYELQEAGYQPATAVFVPSVGEVDLVLTSHPQDLVPGLTPGTQALRAGAGSALLIETDGYAFHSSHLDWERDHLRDQAAIAAGHVPLHLTSRQVLQHSTVEIVAPVAARLGTTPSQPLRAK